MEQVITMAKLKELCDAYDEQFGNWPESKNEGFAIYDWVVSQLETPPANGV